MRAVPILQLSLPSVLGHGVSQIFEPQMSEEERQGLQPSAELE